MKHIVMLFLAAALTPQVEMVGEAERFAPDIASTRHSEVRLTLSPDGRTALWFSRDRPGGAGGYDIWIARRTAAGWGAAAPVPFNGPTRDFDPAFSADGRFVYFCSDRPGGLGGDDVYRVAVRPDGFGAPANLGALVNSAGNEFAPMLSPDGRALLFSSDRPGGAGGHDLYLSAHRGGRFAAARRLAGAVNTAANEFDATFLADGATIVFARAMDFRKDRVALFHAFRSRRGYGTGSLLPPSINGSGDAYGPMLDWSDRSRLIFAGHRGADTGMDLYRIRYRIVR